LLDEKMEIKNSDSDQFYGELQVTFKHEDYGSHTLKLEGGGLFVSEGGFFYVVPKYRELGGHRYYMAIKFKADLKVGETYELNRNDEPVSAHLEIDDIDGDKYSSGTLRLSKGGEYPEGEFDLSEEGVFSAVGTFKFKV
jgi:hypothetical protein